MDRRTDILGRKKLPHDPPFRIDPATHLFFITICAATRVGDPLLPHATSLLASAQEYQRQGKWYARIFLIMPDHLHAILRFPPESSLRETVRGWKRWTARTLKIQWQDGFFDHRLRKEESEDDKARYILENPVRAGLVPIPEEWPHFYLGAIDESLK